MVARRTVLWAGAMMMGDKGRGGRANLASSSALAVWAMAHRNAAASGRRRDTPNERHTTDRHRGVAAAAAARRWRFATGSAAAMIRRFTDGAMTHHPSSSSGSKAPKAATTTTRRHQRGWYGTLLAGWKHIIASGFRSLRDGGIVVYPTCSLGRRREEKPT